MNHEMLFATLAIGATLATAAPAVHAEYVPPYLEARLQAAADAGPDQLRVLLWRTRGIYGLSMDEAVQHLQGSSREAVEPQTDAIDLLDGEGGAPVASPEPADDTFDREFFRNDARD